MKMLGLMLTLSCLSTLPRLAHAGEVECESEYGACSVSNEGQDFVGCGCANESGTGGTGGNEWEDFDDEELMAICEAELAFCGAPEDPDDEDPDQEPGCGGGSHDEGGGEGDDGSGIADAGLGQRACSVSSGTGDAGLGLGALLGLWGLGRRRRGAGKRRA
jgi:MYXO-CTERM domain-containing protein